MAIKEYKKIDFFDIQQRQYEALEKYMFELQQRIDKSIEKLNYYKDKQYGIWELETILEILKGESNE